ncbi:odorant receptor 30a-like isoform X3 [Cylas formicarius]|uniref:odorant receptor 30a-like isoform X3 n=1 Tax=Cylas formicarius TaxID=197179 RepID=UPI002958A4FC|nr:odorant receptor 30a-like isoform X3 [Cylas formicarius]
MDHVNLTQQYFRYIKWLMIIGGIWRIEIEEFSVPKRTLYQTYSICIQMGFFSSLISFILNMPTLLKTDMPAAISTMGLMTFSVVMLTKMFMCQSKSIVRLLRLALQSEFQVAGDINAEIKAIYEWHINCGNNVVSILFFGALFVGICVNIFGDINCYIYFKQHRGENMTDKPVPLNYWYPFDRNKHYAVVLIDQNIRAILASLLIAVVGAFVCCIFVFVRLQLTLLQHSFRNFDKLNNIQGASLLKRLCVKHQKLIGYVDDLKESFKTIILLEYIVSSLSFAAQILQITLGARPFFAFLLLTYTAMQLLVFAWTSNEIIIQSSELARGLFESDWYQHDTETQIMVHIMIVRCQKPLCLRVGHFGVMDLDVGLSRLKLAYSYASLMTNGT